MRQLDLQLKWFGPSGMFSPCSHRPHLQLHYSHYVRFQNTAMSTNKYNKEKNPQKICLDHYFYCKYKRLCTFIPLIYRDCKKGPVPYCQCLSLRVKMNKYMKLLKTAELVRQRSCCCLLDWCNFNCFVDHRVTDVFGADVC